MRERAVLTPPGFDEIILEPNNLISEVVDSG